MGRAPCTSNCHNTLHSLNSLRFSLLLHTRTPHQDSGDTGALSDKARTSLKSALSVLGVSHDGLIYNGEEHSIFVLGLDAEDLREVVRTISRCYGLSAYCRVIIVTVCGWASLPHIQQSFCKEKWGVAWKRACLRVAVALPPSPTHPLLSSHFSLPGYNFDDEQKGVSTVRGVRKHLALSPREIFPGAVPEPPEVRRAPVAPEQVLQVAPPKKFFGRPADVRGTVPRERLVGLFCLPISQIRRLPSTVNILTYYCCPS